MFERIASDPAVPGGKRCVRDIRLGVEFLREPAAPDASRGKT